MGYILDGAGVDSPECRQLRVNSNMQFDEGKNVSAIVLFDVKDAFLEHDGPENHYRPYLTLLGRPAAVQAKMPYNITTLRYQSANDQKMISYRYDFTRENLAELAAKGMFDEGFEPSKIAKNSRYELPCEISYVAFPPDEASEGLEDENGNPVPNPPVIFASLHQGSLHCNDETSGYTIHEYFEPVVESDLDKNLPKYELPAAARVLGQNFTFDGVGVAEPAKIEVEKPSEAVEQKPDREPQFGRKRPGRAVSVGQRVQKQDAPVRESQDVEKPAPNPVQAAMAAAMSAEKQAAPKPVAPAQQRDMRGLDVKESVVDDDYEDSLI